MLTLTDLLARIPAVYEDLTDAHRVRMGTGEKVSGGDKDRTPGNLSVMEHRHKLPRILWWWVDAIHDGEEVKPSSSDVRSMCGWLSARVRVMDAEDASEFRGELYGWRDQAYRLIDPTPPEKGELRTLPVETVEAYVPVHEAAKLLGCTVRTIQRRAPRAGGTVRLGDALTESDLCTHGLWVRTCTLCQSESVA